MFELILNTLQSADTPACCFFAGTPKREIGLSDDVRIFNAIVTYRYGLIEYLLSVYITVLCNTDQIVS